MRLFFISSCIHYRQWIFCWVRNNTACGRASSEKKNAKKNAHSATSEGAVQRTNHIKRAVQKMNHIKRAVQKMNHIERAVQKMNHIKRVVQRTNHIKRGCPKNEPHLTGLSKKWTTLKGAMSNKTPQQPYSAMGSSNYFRSKRQS